VQTILSVFPGIYLFDGRHFDALTIYDKMQSGVDECYFGVKVTRIHIISQLHNELYTLSISTDWKRKLWEFIFFFSLHPLSQFYFKNQNSVLIRCSKCPQIFDLKTAQNMSLSPPKLYTNLACRLTWQCELQHLALTLCGNSCQTHLKQSALN
jgi:hypothetical protein